ncbi:CYTH domain-containing protein [Rhizobium sp. TRM95111]|uniref:CYTH domain-containing protein n=1 Tax=Rhizobium alarense TaxID=2846851 RepID=UPI001F256185|nr:CYTH domain-containing protein [Rhizobium alarense]MCF3642245.1 CYTH domain-containing protein [Rhizobium alarense]
MAKEIERKFLVSSNRWRLQADGGVAIRQAYLTALDDRSLRVRTFADGQARLTLKVGQSALVRDEYEFDIDRTEAEDMMSHAVGKVIEKVRYKVHVGEHIWEVDVYGGDYNGLVIAEVELASTRDRPEIPDWVGREVTGDARYSNQAMALGELATGAVNALHHQA